MLVSEVIDRSYSYLYGDENLPAFDILDGTINASAMQMGTEGLQTYTPQTIVEIDSELILTKEAESSTTIDLNERGYRETTAASHTDGTKIYINPEFTRIGLFNAVVQVVTSLYGMGLFRLTQDTSLTPSVTSPIALPSGAKRVVEVFVRQGSLQWTRLQKGIHYEVLSAFSPPVLQLFTGVGYSLAVSYTSDFTTPTTEADNLDTLGIPASLQHHFPKAVASVALEGKDIPSVVNEEVKNRLAAEGERVGLGMTVSQALWQAFERQVGRERAVLSERFSNQVIVDS